MSQPIHHSVVWWLVLTQDSLTTKGVAMRATYIETDMQYSRDSKSRMLCGVAAAFYFPTGRVRLP